MKTRRIYLASSWRNAHQPEYLAALRRSGHEVYDFRNPKPGDKGFAWSEIDDAWQRWDLRGFRERLTHPTANHGFANDWNAMEWADTGVLLLPCGRSAHLEAGYFTGRNKQLFIVLHEDKFEPELMYKMATAICCDLVELIDALHEPK
jgi:nucleoside 2-deoxyribosyltransferase